MKNQVIVLIPVYKEKCSTQEMQSLKQCIKLLYNYPITFFAPEGLDTFLYTSTATNSAVISFPESYFKNRDTYSNLLLSNFFYESFVDFEYMLIYQLDCFIFRDELSSFCNKNYDYIGPPSFIKKEANWNKPENWSVGNGGFSLRKIDAFLNVLNSKKNFFPRAAYLELMKKNGKNKILSFFMSFLKQLGFRNKIKWIVENFEGNEDEFWSKWVLYIEPDFKKPTVIEASKFGLELNAPFFYQNNDKVLPFGCHAWDKYTPDFWESFIPEKL